ncbi:MAG: WD40 repeat domain-containing protein [Desulfuromonadaceae bacterium]
MNQIIKYLFFIVFLVSALFVAANYDLTTLFGSRGSSAAKGTPGRNSFRGISISKKPSALLTGLTGQVVLDYSAPYNLTAAAVDDIIKVWQLPETTVLRELDCGEGFQALSLRFMPASSLIAVGGMKMDNTGSIGFFDAATGKQILQLDEPEPILSVDPHPAGKYLLVTAESYIKVIDIKDGNSVVILQKINPAARACYYGNGQYVLQTDSLSLFDLKKRSMAGSLDPVMPLLFKKGLDGATYAWLSADGVSVVTAAEPGKRFFPLATHGITAFDVDSRGVWGLFLLDTQKIAVIELASGKISTAIELTSPASDVTISSDGTTAYVLYASGSIGVYDIGYRNKLKRAQFGLAKLFSTMKNKVKPAPQPAAQ